MDFTRLDYLKEGNKKQREVYKLLRENSVFEILDEFDPGLAGTIPIGIDTAESDLDILCNMQNADHFEEFLEKQFGQEREFEINRKYIREQFSIICRFRIGDFRLEIFGQNRPVIKQDAYRHMLVEHEILQEKGENFRQQVIALKQNGFKTEPAFAELLGLQGDPYLELLKLEKL